MPRAVAFLLLLFANACAVPKALFTSSNDLTDYRAFRIAAHEGVRLARAQRYIERHPRGMWVDDVRRAFDQEEPLYFERASETRAKVSEYLADLPRGPHADAAIALLTAFDTHLEDEETGRILREASRTEAKLEIAGRRRHALGEAILGDVAALLDPDVYGAKADGLPVALRKALGGLAPASWGRPEPRRVDDYFYSIPTHLVRESRLATLILAVDFDRAGAIQGIVSGPDLFVHWDEADKVEARDPTDPKDRALGAAHAADVLAGAFEGRLPASHCAISSSAPREILVRRCDGWIAVVTIGKNPGDADAIVIAGPPK